MKKYLLPAMLAAAFLLASCETAENTGTAKTPMEPVQTTVPIQPDRKMDIYGKITAIEGNEIALSQVDTSKDPTFSMTAAEKRKYMQAMDEASRMALKEKINSAILWEVKITVPVGILMIKKTAQWPEAPETEASLADMKKWQYISVWLAPESKNAKISEFVKIAFTQ